MASIATVHQCLFCSQTFGCAADKDDHILQHFDQEKCMDCDGNLIRIGSKLYTLHDDVTCIKRIPKSEKDIEVRSTYGNVTENYVPNSDGPGVLEIKTEIFIPEREDDFTGEKDCLRPATYPNRAVNSSAYVIEPIVCLNKCGMQEGPSVKREQQSNTTCLEKTGTAKQTLTSNIQNIQKIANQETEKMECKKCSREFYRKYAFRLHEAKCIGEKYPCDVCGKLFASKTVVRVHKRSIHKAPDQFCCTICRKIFLVAEDLAKHRPACQQKRNSCPSVCIGQMFECDICKKHYTSKLGLTQHMRLMHTQTRKKYQCESCGIMCNSKYAIEIHYQAQHLGVHKFTCDICGKGFLQRSHLEYHKNGHAGITPFSCSFEGCDKSFKSPIILKSHMQTHNKFEKGPNQFECLYKGCNRMLANPQSRRIHMRTHTGEKKYQCHIEGCEKQYAVHRGFMLHMFSAHGISNSTHTCEICSKVFPQSGMLKTHMRKHLEKKNDIK